MAGHSPCRAAGAFVVHVKNGLAQVVLGRLGAVEVVGVGYNAAL